MENIIIVGEVISGQYTCIQNAIDAIVDLGDTCTTTTIRLNSGTYTEDLVINKRIRIVAESDVIIQGSITVDHGRIHLEGFTISGGTSSSGIFMDDKKHCKFINLTSVGHLNGFEFINVEDVTLLGCIASNNTEFGFKVSGSTNVNFSENGGNGCYANDNADGFGIFDSTMITLHDAIADNHLTGYGFKTDTSTVNFEAVRATNNLIGISLNSSDISVIAQGYISNNGTGIELINSDNCLIHQTPINYSATWDLSIDATSQNNFIVHNFYHNNDVNDLGVGTWFSNNHIDDSEHNIIQRDSDVATIKYVDQYVTSGVEVPKTKPTKIGNIYVDTIARQSYIALGTYSPIDWVRQANMDDFKPRAPITSCAIITDAVTGTTVGVDITVSRDKFVSGWLIPSYPGAGFTDIGVFSLTLDYDFTVMQYLTETWNVLIEGAYITDSDTGTGLAPGYHRLLMSWLSFAGPVTIADDSILVTINFNYTSGSTPLTWKIPGNFCEYAEITGEYIFGDAPKESYYIHGSVSSS